MINTYGIEGAYLQPQQMTEEQMKEREEKYQAAERAREEKALELFLTYFNKLKESGVPEHIASDVTRIVLFGPVQRY